MRWKGGRAFATRHLTQNELRKEIAKRCGGVEVQTFGPTACRTVVIIDSFNRELHRFTALVGLDRACLDTVWEILNENDRKVRDGNR